jgi:hypothetical protein
VASKPAFAEQLYERDFALWLEEQARALRERRSAALDWDNLAEEVGGLVRSDRRSLKSFLQNALLHMIELAYWEIERERNQHQWRDHLMSARDGITNIIEDSPSLGNYLGEILEASYQHARRRAENRTGLELPINCPWTLEQIQDDAFHPELTLATQ